MRVAPSLMLVCLLGGIAACGTTEPPPARWSSAMHQLYDRSSFRPPDVSLDQFTYGERELLLKRLGFADMVALGRARQVTLFAELGAPRRIAVAFAPQRVIFGTIEELDTQGELLLPLTGADGDFRMSLRSLARLPGSRYLLLLKRGPKQQGATSLHWVIYRPEPKLMRFVRALFSKLRQHQETSD